MHTALRIEFDREKWRSPVAPLKDVALRGPGMTMLSLDLDYYSSKQCLYLSLHIYLKILEMLSFNGLIYLSDFGMTWYLLPRSSLYSRVPPPLLGVPYCACATDPPGSPPPVFGSPITIHIISTKRLIGSRRNKGVCLPRQPPTVRPWAWGPWAACQPSLIIKSVKNALGKRVRHLRSNLSNLASFIISVYTSILL